MYMIKAILVNDEVSDVHYAFPLTTLLYAYIDFQTASIKATNPPICSKVYARQESLGSACLPTASNTRCSIILDNCAYIITFHLGYGHLT